MTAWQRRLPLALIACSLLALGAVNLTKGTPSTGQPATGQPSTAPSPESSADLVPRIAIAYDLGGRGSAGVNELAREGVKRAADEFGAEFKEITARPDDTDADREERLDGAGRRPLLPDLRHRFHLCRRSGQGRPEVPRHLVRHRRRRQRECAEGDRHPVQRGAGLLPRRRGRRAHVEDGQRRLRRRGPEPGAREVRGGLHGGCPGRRPGRQGPGRVPLAAARLRRRRATQPRPGRPRWACTTRAPMSSSGRTATRATG